MDNTIKEPPLLLETQDFQTTLYRNPVSIGQGTGGCSEFFAPTKPEKVIPTSIRTNSKSPGYQPISTSGKWGGAGITSQS
jgi:hypothetical protein